MPQHRLGTAAAVVLLTCGPRAASSERCGTADVFAIDMGGDGGWFDWDPFSWGTANFDTAAIPGRCTSLKIICRSDSGARLSHWECAGNAGAVAVANAIETNTELVEVIMRGSYIGNTGAVALANSLETETDINGNSDQASPGTALTVLDLGNNRIGDAGAVALAKTLETNAVLTKLVLEGNEIGDDGVAALAKALKTNTVLRELYLSGNRIGKAGATALAEALEGNTDLTTLHMGRNRIGNAGAVAMAKALETNAELTGLLMEQNEIGNVGATALATALETNTALTALYLGYNRIGDAGARALAKALDANTELDLLSLAGVKGVTDSLKTKIHDLAKQPRNLKNGTGLGCSDNLDCLSNSCRDGRCCKESSGCVTCDALGDCTTCSGDHTLRELVCVKNPLPKGAVCTIDADCEDGSCKDSRCCGRKGRGVGCVSCDDDGACQQCLGMCVDVNTTNIDINGDGADDTTKKICKDVPGKFLNYESCADAARAGFCTHKKLKMMKVQCPLSCGTCVGHVATCLKLAEHGMCKHAEHGPKITKKCPLSCGICGAAGEPTPVSDYRLVNGKCVVIPKKDGSNCADDNECGGNDCRGGRCCGPNGRVEGCIECDRYGDVEACAAGYTVDETSEVDTCVAIRNTKPDTESERSPEPDGEREEL